MEESIALARRLRPRRTLLVGMGHAIAALDGAPCDQPCAAPALARGGAGHTARARWPVCAAGYMTRTVSVRAPSVALVPTFSLI
eukprot:scaffold81311_cov49-Phaeocystis_antarctica.AAC.1